MRLLGFNVKMDESMRKPVKHPANQMTMLNEVDDGGYWGELIDIKQLGSRDTLANKTIENTMERNRQNQSGSKRICFV